MDYFEYKKSNFQLERSILQKAVRRGSVVWVEKIVLYLMAEGDSPWLKKRLFVMAYEECWPLGVEMNPKNLLDSYAKLAKSVKNKNAAGLAKLAEKFNSRDYDIPSKLSQNMKIEIQDMAKAIKNTIAFWEKVEAHENYATAKTRILAAKDAVKKAPFNGDKAVMYAAAYLALNGNIPLVQPAQQKQPDEFPLWVGFDKHTDLGKEAIAKAAEAVGLNMFQGFRLAFYIEGSACNEIYDSPYWAELVRWQLSRMEGITISKALDYWERMKPLVIQPVQPWIAKPEERISNTKKMPDNGQLSLFP